MARMSASKVKNQYSFEGISLSQADFSDAPATGTSIDAGEVREIARAEIGEDGQLSSYDLVRLGNDQGGNPDSARGKLYAHLEDGSGNAVDNRTEVRFISRPKNGNRRTPLTTWHTLRSLDVDRPDHRIALRPVSKGGKPVYIQDGRILAVEVRNEATSVTVDRSASTIEAPARGGY